jgi:H+/gluconate symporter-like permease
MLGLSGILVALFLLIWLAYRGGSVLLLAPAAALVAAAVSREPLQNQDARPASRADAHIRRR